MRLLYAATSWQSSADSAYLHRGLPDVTQEPRTTRPMRSSRIKRLLASVYLLSITELRAISIVETRQRLRRELLHTLHTELPQESWNCFNDKNKNNYLRQSYHDHLHRELLLGRTAHSCQDHRHLELLLGTTRTAARFGIQPLQSEYVRTYCCKTQHERSDYFFEYILFRFEHVAAGLLFSTTIVGNTGSALACARRVGSRLLSLLVVVE